MSPRHFDNTKDRLFGTPESSPRRAIVSDTYRSNVFDGNDFPKSTAIDSPKKKAISKQNKIGVLSVQEFA